MAEHNLLGKEGEMQALTYLKERGYEILEKNYQVRKTEIDIIALKNETIVVVEVKTRTSIDYGNPEDFVNKSKIKRLVIAIDDYIQKNNLDYEVRFDIISVIKQNNLLKIEHLIDAFYYF